MSLVLSVSAQCAVIAYFGQFLYVQVSVFQAATCLSFQMVVKSFDVFSSKLQFKLSVGIIGLIYLASLLLYAVGTVLAGQLTDKLVIKLCIYQ